MTGRHYISTGALNCFYTLRYTFTEYGRRHVGDGQFEEFTMVRDYHCRNLSTDREQAIAKAHEITGRPLTAAFEVSPITRRSDIDWSVLQGGKHEGRSIHELRETEEGREYLCFLAENCAGNKRYAQTVDLIKALLAHELGARAEERQQEADSIAAERTAVAARCKPIIEVLKHENGDFCASIAKDLENGFLPRGRAHSIVMDIYAKAHGRRNSKAYENAYDDADEMLSEESLTLSN